MYKIYAIVKIQRIVNLIFVHFLKCKLYFNFFKKMKKIFFLCYSNPVTQNCLLRKLVQLYNHYMNCSIFRIQWICFSFWKILLTIIYIFSLDKNKRLLPEEFLIFKNLTQFSSFDQVYWPSKKTKYVLCSTFFPNFKLIYIVVVKIQSKLI